MARKSRLVGGRSNEQPVDPKMGVHNLEQGGVLIQYGSKVPREQVDRLRDYWRNDANRFKGPERLPPEALQPGS